jgi:hypothetical protein
MTSASSNADDDEQISNSTQTSDLAVVEAQTIQAADVPVTSQVEVNSSGATNQPDKSDLKFTAAPLGEACIITQTPEPRRKNSGKAMASLVCATAGILFYYIFVPIGIMLFPFSICLAVLAIQEMKQEPGDITCKCMAISGLFIGIIGFILSIIYIIFMVFLVIGYKTETPE